MKLSTPRHGKKNDTHKLAAVIKSQTAETVSAYIGRRSKAGKLAKAKTLSPQRCREIAAMLCETADYIDAAMCELPKADGYNDDGDVYHGIPLDIGGKINNVDNDLSNMHTDCYDLAQTLQDVADRLEGKAVAKAV